jgi:hypothetical protein
MKYSDLLRGTNTVEEHMRVAKALGYTWWGKFGLGASKQVIEIARKQLKRGEAVYVYLVSGSRYRYQARLLDIRGESSGFAFASPEPHATPAYYRGEKCRLWMKLAQFQEFDQQIAGDFRLYYDSTSRPSLKSSRGLLYITRLTPASGSAAGSTVAR